MISLTENSKEKMKYNDLTLYIIIVLGLSFSVFGIFYVLGLIFQFLSSEIINIFIMAYMFLPTLTAIIIQKFIRKEKILNIKGLKFGKFTYYLISIITSFIIVFLAFFIALSFPGVEYDKNLEILQQYADLPESLLSLPDPAMIYILTSIPSAIIIGATYNAFFAFGEELGWRGFMLDTLGKKKFGFWRASILIGIVWGFWHAPIILFFGLNYPEHRIEGVFMMVGFTVLLSPILTYLTLKGESVFIASVFHGTLNAIAGISIVLKGGNDLINSVAGLSGFIALIILNIIMVIIDRFLMKNPIIKHKEKSKVN